ncbi:MAG TPA: hypothetical protein PK252_04025 [Bacteroidales bacterium]|nr:hypothetical protein [Bacteroidales bacterium]
MIFQLSQLLQKLKIFILTKAIVTWSWIKSVGRAFKRESEETKIASKILLKMLKGKDVTPEEVQFLKGQSVDLGKALALIGLQAIPGSSFAIIAIEKVAQKYGFTLFPQEQKELKKSANKKNP